MRTENPDRPGDSWIVVERSTGRAVLETFSRRTADAINLRLYEVLPAGEYLRRFNQRVKQGTIGQ